MASRQPLWLLVAPGWLELSGVSGLTWSSVPGIRVLTPCQEEQVCWVENGQPGTKAVGKTLRRKAKTTERKLDGTSKKVSEIASRS